MKGSLESEKSHLSFGMETFTFEQASRKDRSKQLTRSHAEKN